MTRLIIVSNRLIVRVVETEENKLEFQPSMGGLATGLGAFCERNKEYEISWVGWPGITLESLRQGKKRLDEILETLTAQNNYPVFLTKEEMDKYYHGFCNDTIWPLFHYFPQYTVFDWNFWHAYEAVNRKFASAVLDVYKEGDFIWIHDYHLMLLPKMLREELPDAPIGYFLHIPFPSYELFRLLPWRIEILEGVLGADLIGFHTYDYVRHFLSSIRRLLGLEHQFGEVLIGNRMVKVDTFPMGIDFRRFSLAHQDMDVQKEVRNLHVKIGERKIILSIDRLDYTKGIANRLKAFDQFLDKYPDYKEKVTLMLVVVPSRTKVPHYESLKREIDELVGFINGKHGSMGWVPIWYFYRYFPFKQLVSLYQIGDVALITPLRDGMNLIAKEYIATKTFGQGMLILSEFAGAASELGEAIIINPHNINELREAIRDALEMDENEQVKRMKFMQKRIKRYNVVKWANDYLTSLMDIRAAQQSYVSKYVTENIKKELLSEHENSKKRLFLLDYDGTLVNFDKDPAKVAPDEELLHILTNLGMKAENDVVIISGRSMDILNEWLGNTPVHLIAEHGAWIKKHGEDPHLIEPLKNDWKEAIRPILETHVDRTPGSFIEEKTYSLVWHYRRAEPELGERRARELIDALSTMTANLDVGILEGDKVVEVKNMGIDKGKAVTKWLEQDNWDFILAMGDDRTDEDMFAVLATKNAHTIKVGLKPTKAHYIVASPKEARDLLRTFI